MGELDALARALDAGAIDTPEAREAVEALGPGALLLRGLARVRRRQWASARRDAMQVAIGDPVWDFVAGTILYACRDYGGSLSRFEVLLGARGHPALVRSATQWSLRISGELGWLDDQRRVWERLASDPHSARGLRAMVESRREAMRQRAREVLAAPLELAPGRALARLASDGVDAARESFLALEEHHGGTPALIAAHARLELAHGQLEQARELLEGRSEEVLDAPRAALALARGDIDQALARTVHHDDDPWLLALRGEALAASAGSSSSDWVRAADMLEESRRLRPDSVAIATSLALVRHRCEPSAEALAQRFGDLLHRAPGLLVDAGARVGIHPFGDRGPLSESGGATPEAVAQMLEILGQARDMLGADRHPDTCGYERGRCLGFFAPAGDVPHLDRLHGSRREEEGILLAESVLWRALGRRPTSRAAPAPSSSLPLPASWSPQTLTREEIDDFLRDGHLILRAAFDPAISARWIADANRRIRSEPERWVKHYDPNDPSRSLANYDPERPDTWTWPRLDLVGDESMAIEAFSARAWAIILDLLGGPARIKTRTWTNYLIPNFNADAELDVPGPGPDWKSWHIDDPSPASRLDQITRGLVVIAIHSHLPPRSGGTWLATDSVARVARLMASRPEGVDFCSGRGAGVVAECERFVEITGEVGDLVLMHPLMMHSSAPNPSGRIRWMGNPMVYLDEPLDPWRPIDELSPVELAIRRAIQ